MKITIHPLFFAFGLYFALTGKVFLFLTFTLTALLHEYGHASTAEKLGYKMNKISLMPYGAVINGAIEGLSYKDEVLVALMGPLTNLAVCVFFVCLWWLIPESYPYTETIVFSNLSVAAINLLPAWPLDGGRIFSAALSLITTRKKAMLIVKITGIVCAVALFALFLFSIIKNNINISILFFALFMLTGAITKTKENAYVKIFKNRSIYLGGIKERKRLILSGDLTLKQLMQKTEGNCFYALDITDKKTGEIKSLSVKQTEEILSSYLLYDTLNDIINSSNNKKVGL